MKWRRLLSALSLLICTLCVVLKFWPSDRWQMFSVFVYLPPLLLIVWLVVHLLALGLHRWIALTLMLFIFTFSIWREHKAACAYSSGLATVRILHWNVWSLRKGVDRILQTIAEQKPDIICLNESKTSRNAPTYPPFAKRLHSLTGTEWDVYNTNYMSVISKYPIGKKRVWKGYGYQALQATIQAQAPIDLFLIDVTPSIAFSRRAAFLDLSRVLAQNQPDVIAGDFNTPSHAASLNALLTEYQDPHCGLDYTWPMIMPLMRIDYLLIRKEIRISGHSSKFTLLSDHAWQIIDVIP